MSTTFRSPLPLDVRPQHGEFHGSILGLEEVEKPLVLRKLIDTCLLARDINVIDGVDLSDNRRFYADDPCSNLIESVELQRSLIVVAPHQISFKRALIAHNVFSASSRCHSK